jgi:deoxyribose-phosphate aldolase
VYQEIAAVLMASDGRPVKVILECHYLNDNQIRVGCDLAIKAGAAFVKTGTGWAPTGATLENIALIKNHVGNAIQIKASGGIRSLETIQAMHHLGATRFGISVGHASRILSAILPTQLPMEPNNCGSDL